MKQISSERSHNWLSFVELIEKLAPLPAPDQPADVWLFRGEADADAGLVPSIEKYDFLKPVRETEHLMLYDFQTGAPLVAADDVPPETDLAGWLSLMRHHGVPTRLLDWSYSPYVAAYFALARKTAGDTSAVWVLNMTVVESRAMQVARRLNWSPLPNGRLDFSEPHFLQSYALTPKYEESRHRGTGLVVPILPRSRSQRLVNQQGIFLLNCNYEMSFWDSLTAMMEPPKGAAVENWIRRIEIPRSERLSILRRLFQQNTHPFTLFSDLDSLGKSLLLKRELYPEGSLRLPASWND